MSWHENEIFLENKYEQGLAKGMTEKQAEEYAQKCFEDMLLDLKHMAKAKTFKQVCELQGRDYKEEIQMLKRDKHD